MIKPKEKRFHPGDLALIRSDEDPVGPHHSQSEWTPAIIIDSREMSVHVMDRPKRIVDTVQYRVYSDGKRKIVYDEEIYEFSNGAINN